METSHIEHTIDLTPEEVVAVVGQKRKWRKRYYTRLIREKVGEHVLHLPRHVDLYQRKIFIFNTCSKAASPPPTAEIAWVEKAAAAEDAAGGFPPTGRQRKKRTTSQN